LWDTRFAPAREPAESPENRDNPDIFHHSVESMKWLPGL